MCNQNSDEALCSKYAYIINYVYSYVLHSIVIAKITKLVKKIRSVFFYSQLNNPSGDECRI